MKTPLSLLALVLILSACGSTSHYREATSDTSPGYQQQQLAQGQWQVSYRQYGTQLKQTYPLALRRAAELTRQEGYDWFEVVNRDSEIAEQDEGAELSTGISRSYNTETRCGLLGCTRQTTPSTRYDVGVSNNSGRQVTETVLEIRMGKGVRPEQAGIYSAEEVLAQSK